MTTSCVRRDGTVVNVPVDVDKPQEGANAETKPQEGASIEGKPEGGPAAEGQGGGEDVRDSHGQPGINKERHDKEVAALNDKIKELTDKLDESAKTEKARADLKAEIEKVRAEIDEERTAWKLEKAGCRNVKAAKALLGDYGGDVAKLKAECPYLFEEDKPKGATGGRPAGASNDKASREARAVSAAGLPEGTKLD